MGTFLSTFQATRSTKERLEELEKDIESCEDYKRNGGRRHMTVVHWLLLYTFLLYILCAGVFFLYYFPEATWERVAYSFALLIFPIILYGLKKILYWRFREKNRSNDETLIELKKQKKTLLEYAMETETYKVVKELLDKNSKEKELLLPL